MNQQGDGGEQHAAAVAFPAGVYSLDAIKKAAYRLLDVAVIDITPREGEVMCAVRFRKPVSAERAAQIVDEFKVEVLDQDLRASIAAETSGIRNVVLGLAFSKTGLQGE